MEFFKPDIVCFLAGGGGLFIIFMREFLERINHAKYKSKITSD